MEPLVSAEDANVLILAKRGALLEVEERSVVICVDDCPQAGLG